MNSPSKTPSLTLWQFLDSSGFGGIESHVRVLASALRERGHEVRVMFYHAHRHSHPLHELLALDGTPHTTLSDGAKELWRRLRQAPPDLLHTHGYKAGIIGRLFGRLLNLPVVSTYHAGEPGSGKLRLYVWIDRLTAGLAHPIAVSRKIAATLPANTTLIRNFVPLPPREEGAPLGEAIAFVGRLSEEKGPDLFCALADHLSNLGEADLRIFGDGPMRTELEQRYQNRIQFVGQVPSMEPYWREIGLLCMPSRHEGLPMAALEAMAHGIPVIGSEVGDLPELLSEQAGWLIPSDHPSALCEAVERWRALSPAGRRERSRAAVERIRAEYAADRIIDEILSVYQTALARAAQ